MKRNILLLLTAFFLLHFSQAQAQEQEPENNKTFELSGQLRSRGELRDGAFRPLSKDEKAAALIQNRVRINMGYKYKDVLETKISIQNVNIWGQANTFQANDKSDNTTSLFEGWAALKVTDGLKIKAGRQTISYEDGRLFDATDWTNSGRSHDALGILFNKKKVSVNAYLAFNQNYDALYGNNANNPSGNLYNPADAQNYKTMQTVWGAYQLDDHAHLSVLFSNVGFQNALSQNDDVKVKFLQTTGVFYDFKYPNVFGNLSAYIQTGRVAPGADKSGAYLVSGNVGFPITDQLKLSLGTDYMSGNAVDGTSDKNKAFQPLYGTGHKFFGSMDYFTRVEEGLMDNNLSLIYTFNPRISGSLVGHAFSATADMGDLSKNLGQEIDLNLNFNLQKYVTLNGGFSTYFKTNSLLAMKGVTNAQSLQKWVWLSLNIHPEFFKLHF